MAEPILPPDFSEFLRLLNAHQVDCLIVGGYAVGFHGHPRATAHATLDGVDVRLIALDDLKTNKRAAGRHQDVADLDHLP